MKKRLLTLAMVLALCLTMVPITALAVGDSVTVVGENVEITITDVVKEITVDLPESEVEGIEGGAVTVYLVDANGTTISFDIKDDSFDDPWCTSGLWSLQDDGTYSWKRIADYELEHYGDNMAYWGYYVDPINFDGFIDGSEIYYYSYGDLDNFRSYADAGFYIGATVVSAEETDSGETGPVETDSGEPDVSGPAAANPLDGADEWALEELALALEAGLVLDEMIGNWTEPMTRLLAAEAIVRLIEVSTGKTINEIAEENEYNMEDAFDDTDSKAVTFLKAAEISDGVGDNMYDPSGIYNRAQMVTMIGRAALHVFDIDISEYPPGSDVFTDVPEWADAFVGWAAAVGITDGVGGGLFNSVGALQNQHTGVFAYRAFDKAFSAGE